MSDKDLTLNDQQKPALKWDEIISRKWLIEQGIYPDADSWNPSPLTTFVKFMEMMHHQETGFNGPPDYDAISDQLFGEMESQWWKVLKTLQHKILGKDGADYLEKKRSSNNITEINFGLIPLAETTNLAEIKSSIYKEMRDFLGDGTDIWYREYTAAHSFPLSEEDPILKNDNRTMEAMLRQIRLMQMYSDGELYVKIKEAAEDTEAEFKQLLGAEDTKLSIDGGLLYNRYGESLAEAQKIYYKLEDEPHTIRDRENDIRYENPNAVDKTFYRYHDTNLSGATLDELTYENFAVKFDIFMGHFKKPIMRNLFGGEIFKTLPDFSESKKSQEAASVVLAMRLEAFEASDKNEKDAFEEEYREERGISEDLPEAEFNHLMRGFDGWMHQKKLQTALPQKAGDVPTDLEGHRQAKYLTPAWLDKKQFELEYLALAVDIGELRNVGLYPHYVIQRDCFGNSAGRPMIDTPEQNAKLIQVISLRKQFAYFNTAKPETPEQKAALQSVKDKVAAFRSLLKKNPKMQDELEYALTGQSSWADSAGESDRYFALTRQNEQDICGYEALTKFIQTGKYTPTAEEKELLAAQITQARRTIFGGVDGEFTEKALREDIPNTQTAKTLLKAISLLKAKQLYAREGDEIVNLSRFSDFEKLSPDMVLCDAEGAPLSTLVLPKGESLGDKITRIMSNAKDERTAEEKYPLTFHGLNATEPQPVTLGIFQHWQFEKIVQSALDSFGMGAKSITSKAILHSLKSDIPHLYPALQAGPKKGTDHLKLGAGDDGVISLI